MNRATLESMLTSVDERLVSPTTMVIYGAAAFMLLGEEARISADVDVAGPYCIGDVASLRRAIVDAGYAINPPPEHQGDHVEWVGIERLSLEDPVEHSMTLWHGANLSVITVPPPSLIASKLIRYDETDQSDIRTLCGRMKIQWEQIRDAANRLPPAFRDDALVKENLENLRNDMIMWGLS